MACNEFEAKEAVVGRVVDVQNVPGAFDHVFVALANRTLASSNWVGTENPVVDKFVVVIHRIWSAVGTEVKSNTAVTLQGYFNNFL